MQTRSYDENSVCTSVRLSICQSVKRVHCDKTTERSVQIFVPYERSFILVFWEKEWLVGVIIIIIINEFHRDENLKQNFRAGDPFYLKFWVKLTALERNRRFLSIFARSESAVTSSEKSSINTNRKSPTLFPMSPRWTSYIVSKPPKGGSKTRSVRNLNNKLR